MAKFKISNYINFANENGIFNILCTSLLVFAAWLVVNYSTSPVLFFGYGIMVLSAIVYRYLLQSDFFESYRLFNVQWLGDVIFGFIFAGIWWAVMLITPYGIIPIPPLPIEVLAVSTVSWLVIVLLAPFAEELFFRGSLMPQITEWFKGNVWISLAVVSLLFGVFHWLVYLQGALTTQIISAMLFGAFVGILTIWRKSTLPAMIVHVITNGIIVGTALAVIL